MLVPKISSTTSSRTKVVPIRQYGKRLETLYARRSAVESLIRSLEDYQRFRAQRVARQESKTA